MSVAVRVQQGKLIATPNWILRSELSVLSLEGWGIFLKPAEPHHKIAVGAHRGEPVWQDVPGEYRSHLRRILVTQVDTEPASVEQQRHLG